ncbi:MAG TPA: efflux RND transporter periplasmic adaptor subunit [Sphingomicrobium sp.]|nr:efflux RND transporter periplasmic adaptor subunit [Sphingomicrobium sp.]
MNRETSIRTSESDTLIVTDDRARRRKRIAIVGGALIALVAIIIALMMSGGDEKAQPAGGAEARAGQLPTVSVVVPGESQVARVITASGALAARRDQPIGISGSGGKVVRVLVDAGSWVRQGQVLAVVDRSVQAQQVAQLAAQVNAAKADAALAQSNYDRALALKDRGFVSKAEIESKRATRDAANAQVQVAQAQLAAARAELGRLNVTAPTSGLILDRNVEVGQIVSAGSGALFRLARGGEMEMRANLAQEDVAAVRVGMPATVTPIGSDQAITGQVWQVSPIIDPESRQGQVRIAIPYSPAIRPGGFAEAKISSGVATAPLLPQSAVLSDAHGNYVYIINGKNEVERRNVEIGTVNDSGVTIARGISGQERIVLSAGPFLNPGQKVNPRGISAAKALADE